MMAFRVVLAFGGLIVGGIVAAAYAKTHWHMAKGDAEPLSSYLLGLWGICFGTLAFFVIVLSL
jgi:hypothetical protein